MRAVLSIGSNMDDRVKLLKTVFDEFSDDIIAASPVYSTPPWGVEDQDEFLNAVIIVDVEQTPLELLHRGQALEQAADRVRVRHWGPRTLDVAIVEIEGFSSNPDELSAPHPHAAHRASVRVRCMAADLPTRPGGRPVAGLIRLLPQAD